MRLSTWARSASKQNALVDKERWSQIQRNFSTEIRNRMEGKTAQFLTEEIKNLKKNPQSVNQIVCAQGEIKKEYEDLVKHEQERCRLEKEKEEAMSLKLIQEIIQREEAVSFNDYLRVLNANTPTLINVQPAATTSNNNPTTSAALTNEAITSQPLIAPSVASTSQPLIVPSVISISEATTSQTFLTPSMPTGVLNNRLLNRVKSNLSDLNNGNTSTDATASNTPVYSLRPRASIKRNLDEVATLRSNLKNSLKETEQPESKRFNIRNQSSNTSTDAILLNNSTDANGDLNDKTDSKLPVTNLTRRKSTRVGARK